MSRRRGHIWALLAAVSAVCASSSWAYADDTALILGQRRRGPLLTLDPFSGSLELEVLSSFASTKSRNSSSNSSDLSLHETVRLGTGGSVISHPFLSWHGQVGLGLTEEWNHSPGQNRSSFGYVDTYNLAASALSSTILPVSVYAQRSHDYIEQSFAALTQQTQTGYGAAASLRSQTLPTTVRVSHNETVQSTLAGSPDFVVTEDRAEVESRYHPNDQHDVTLHYQYASVDDGNAGVGGGSYQSDDLMLTHDWNIDRAGQYRLSQSLHYSDQVGSFPYDSFSLAENLQMQHTDSFSTFVLYGLDQETAPGSTVLTNRIGGGFMHRLFSSLVTSGSASYSTASNSAGGANSQWSASLGTSYSKRVPLGIFSANIYGSLTQSDTTGAQSPIQVVNESDTFTDPLPIILPRQNVDPSTVQVFNAAGNRLLVKNVDYRLVVENHQTKIQRITGGLLDPNSTVRVNYVVLPTPDSVVSTTTFGLGTRYEFTESVFKGLGIYARYSQQDQGIESAVPDIIIPTHTRDTIFGADYVVWKLQFGAEAQQHESNLSPYDMARFTARYSDNLGQRARLSLGVQQIFTDFHTDQSALTTFDGRLSYDITRQLKALLYVAWRNESNGNSGRTTGFEQNAELRWELRQTRVYLRLRNTMLETRDGDNQTLFLHFGLQRRF